MHKIQPHPTPVSEPYFEGCRLGELRLQQCQTCQRYQFYPRIVCVHCGADQLGWKVVSGRGTVASYTIVRRGVSKAYEAPYVIALIDLQEHVRMMSVLVEVDVDAARIGMPVQVAFEAWSDDITLPVFKPAS